MRNTILLAALLVLFGCESSDDGATDAATAHDAATDAAMSGDAAADSGTHDAAVDGGIDASTDAGSDASVPDFCALPPVGGNCDAYFERWYHDADLGTCERFIYGGCGGNDNNFETLAACEVACDVTPPSEPALAGCEVGGQTFPSGAGGIDDPTSCNTCTCEDGQLTACTEIGCPEPCDDGLELGTSCSQCGPTDACEVVRHACLPTCDAEADCTQPGLGFCFDGVCKNVCG